MEYSTLSARLATFEPPTKRSKAGWPHKRPSAQAVAQAGFYYSPQSTGSDNVVCYLCDRYLDGWEDDDDPVEEHLKHSPECGWAIMMGIAREDKYDVTSMDDPTSTSMAEARRATFAANWPHESKRGWTCKTEKMVEAGWHFAPTDESEDWVTCAYCKLSLDGWEPKDNPFDEHYKRAPECVFFHFAGTTAPSKRPKAKKGRSSKAARTSKASAARVSTQSAISVQPEEVTINDVPDLDESIDTSTTSVVSTLSTTASKRKAAAGRGKSTTTKKAKASSRSTRTKKAKMEMEDTIELAAQAEPEPEVKVEEPAPTPAPEVAEQMAQISQRSEDAEETLGHAPVEDAESAAANAESPATKPASPPTPSADRPVVYPTIPPAEPELESELESEIVAAAAAPALPPPTAANPKSTHPDPSSPIRSHQHHLPPSLTLSDAPGSEVEHDQPSPAHSAAAPAADDDDDDNDDNDDDNNDPAAATAAAPPTPAPAPTPALLPSDRTPISTPASARHDHDRLPWTPVDVDLVFRSDPSDPIFQAAESFLMVDGALDEEEKKMTVQEWIYHLAARAEEELKLESERVVGVFAREGARAMQVLEDLECA